MSDRTELDDFEPFPWAHVRTAPEPRERAKRDAIPADDMQAVAVALYGDCKLCGSLLDVDGTCPNASEHPKHECPECGAQHDAPLTEAAPCLFCSGGVGKARARARARHKREGRMR
jgi:hypothetical protein